DKNSTEVVNDALINLNNSQLASVSDTFKLQRYFTDQRYSLSTEGISAMFNYVPSPPANLSYNTQGVLEEPPLDVSNNRDQSKGSIELQALSPN
ncbi:hypothetical protein DSO57_1000949, partial [Entomophthora muscae]